MGNEWPEEHVEFAERINAAITANINEVFEGVQCDDMQVFCEPHPYLHGYWGTNVHTMTTQAAILGVPTIQLEIPRSV